MKTTLEVDGEHGQPQIGLELEDVHPIDDLADTPLADVSREGLQTLLNHGKITPEEYADEIQRRVEEQETERRQERLSRRLQRRGVAHGGGTNLR